MPLSLSRFPTPSSLSPSSPSNGTDTVHWQGFTKSNFFMRAFKISKRRERERERFLDHFLFFSFFPSPHFYRAIEAVSSRLEYEKMETKRLTAASRFNYRDEWTITSKFSLEVGYYVYIYACVWDICGSLSHILAKKIEISIYIYSGSCQESETRFVERTLMKMIFDVF